MRLRIELPDDVVAAVEKVGRERGLGLSETVSALVQRGLMAESMTRGFSERTHNLGPGVDVSNVAEAIELLDGPAAS
jgi:hypothetical protein